MAVTSINLSKLGMVYHNNFLALPLLFVCAVVAGELPLLPQFEDITSTGFIISTVITGVVGFGLSIGSLWCVQATSPSTYSMVGALNKIPLAVRGSACSLLPPVVSSGRSYIAHVSC